ncbi:relaxase/mobilization nuclease and DUF3363 domain-containing protein [Pseudomonas aeruginosa]|nr:relaxase/mobilization nuclease and DUF3363 domain-containing protein [Pseudomonas aeruginosa]
MTDRRDDDFQVRPSAPKNRGKGRGQSFVSKVLKQAGKASSGKSTVRRPGAAGTGQRPGSRLGRGHTAARFAGAKLTPMSRRVTIKTLLVNHQRASPQSLAKHLRYIERDGAGRDGEPGRAYGPQADEADLDAFKERCADDRHHFRFIVSPEDGAELDDLRTYTRHLVNRMEGDLGTRLDWVAVDHWNTDNPHTHLIVRGRDDTGKDLIIAGDYIAHGFRHRAAELATEWLGPRTELEIQQTLGREVEQERWTSLDRTLQREAGEDGMVQIERFNEPNLQRQRLLLIGRQYDAQRLGGVAVELKSHLPIERQARVIGATWLDQQLIGGGRGLGDLGFGGDAKQAMQERADFLAEQGLAERRGQRVILARNLLGTLRNRELAQAAKDIAAETGLEHRPVADGQRVAGIYRRSVMLASGRYAMLDDGMGFSLVPWRPVIEQRLGQQIVATVRGSGTSWDIGRSRGMGLA